MSSFAFGRFALDFQILWTRFALAFTVFEYRAAPPLDILGTRPGPLPVPDAPAAEVEAPAVRAGQHAVADGAGNPAKQQLVVPAEGVGEDVEEQARWEGGRDEEDVHGEGGDGGPAAGYILALDDATGTSFWVNDGAYIEDNHEFRRHLFITRNLLNGIYYFGREGGTDRILSSCRAGDYDAHHVADARLVLEVPHQHHQLWQHQVSDVGSQGKALVPQPTGRREWLFAGLLDIVQPFFDDDLLDACAHYAAVHGYKGGRAPAWLPADVRAIMEEELAPEPHLEE
ncbi:hypothetical protein Rhopal_000724-T1 [Rhodotorula paludigena]|uniref:Uncharacterized protein n=1 Tax=Rhodotorula paludigena TaxID=86838 RepID=A0AAV5GEJ6_9BASI|nr:hypothetical protein Rhopal_000724-T1 [Rhodotorula paludigena]